MANKHTNKPATLCFTCKTPSPQCSWKYNYTPVEGWEAEKTKIKLYDKHFVDSYLVKSCPLYDENKRYKEKIEELPHIGIKYRRIHRSHNNVKP